MTIRHHLFPPVTTNLSDVELVIDTNIIDTDTWYEMDEVYSAQGGETKMYIGNFRPDDESQAIYLGGQSSKIAYMFIDNVSVNLDTTTAMVGELGSPTAGLKVFPNPANSTLTIETNEKSDGMIRLVDAGGRTVLSSAMTESRMVLDVSGLATGLYTAVLLAKNGVLRKRFDD
ncbi:MAG: hypothetical protein ACI9YU_000360 [Flavobacteriales bacterium]